MTESRFHQEYLPLAQTLYRIAYYILESDTEAEDAVQEVYAKLKREVHSFCKVPVFPGAITGKGLCTGAR